MNNKPEYKVNTVAPFHPMGTAMYVVTRTKSIDDEVLAFDSFTNAQVKDKSPEELLEEIYGVREPESFKIEQFGFVHVSNNGASFEAGTALEFNCTSFPLIGGLAIDKAKVEYANLSSPIFEAYRKIVPHLVRLQINSFGFDEVHGEKMYTLASYHAAQSK